MGGLGLASSATVEGAGFAWSEFPLQNLTAPASPIWCGSCEIITQTQALTRARLNKLPSGLSRLVGHQAGAQAYAHRHRAGASTREQENR
jgi:hypothetical protein